MVSSMFVVETDSGGGGGEAFYQGNGKTADELIPERNGDIQGMLVCMWVCEEGREGQGRIYIDAPSS